MSKLKVLKLNTEETKDFIEEIKKAYEEDNFRGGIFIAIYQDGSSELFSTKMNYIDIIGNLEIQKGLMVNDLINEI